MKPLRGAFVLGCAFAAFTPSYGAQVNEHAPKYEVTSVKPNDSGAPVRIQSRPGRYQATSVSVKQLLMAAYGLRDYQISSGPAWMDEARFDIEGTWAFDPNARPSGLANPRLQNLLADRFGLVAHSEKRVLPVYELEPLNEGMKIHAVAVAEPKPSSSEPGGATANTAPLSALQTPPRPGSIRKSSGIYMASALPMETFVRFLSMTVGRPIIDKAGASGNFDIKLQWAPGVGEIGPVGPLTPVEGSPYGSLYASLAEQLGLRLKPATEPIDVLIIDSIQRPTQNSSPSLSLLRPLDALGYRVNRLLNPPQLDGSFHAIVDDRLRFPGGNDAQDYICTICRATDAGILIRQIEKPCSVQQIGQVRKLVNADRSFADPGRTSPQGLRELKRRTGKTRKGGAYSFYCVEFGSSPRFTAGRARCCAARCRRTDA